MLLSLRLPRSLVRGAVRALQEDGRVRLDTEGI